MRVAVEGGWGGSPGVQAAVTMVVGEAVRACGRWCSGVRWLELMVEVVCSGRSR
jgi:hypothetical protein